MAGFSGGWDSDATHSRFGVALASGAKGLSSRLVPGRILQPLLQLARFISFDFDVWFVEHHWDFSCGLEVRFLLGRLPGKEAAVEVSMVG